MLRSRLPATWWVMRLAALALLGGVAHAQDGAETVFHDARNYTVRIRTQVTTPFMGDEQGSFEGAGFLVDGERHWIVTNAHVVGLSPAAVQVAFVDDKFKPARKIYVDSFNDVAVLEVATGRSHPAVATINCDQVPEIGEAIGAFGHPLGMRYTGTRGIVSGVTNKFTNDLLQIDATVDHGNSGGPVIALRDGRIVGIATAGAGDSKADRLNFATPMKDVCKILDLLRHGVAPDPPQMEFSLLIDEDGGHTLEVGTTYNSTRWPFRPGDRIVAVGREREEVKTLSDLVTALRGRAGKVPLRVRRGGKEIEITVNPNHRAPVVARRGVAIDGALIAPSAFEDVAALSEPSGLMVQSVESGSGAEALGVEQMDIVESIDGRRFDTLESLIAYVDRHKAGSPFRIVFRRMSESMTHWFEYHVRDLPGDDTHVVGPETRLTSGR